MSTAHELKVLFVCMGNICRSPTAEATLRKLVAERGLESRIGIDSAGTHAYHVGSAPDERSIEIALLRNIDMRQQRARRVTATDLVTFDYVLAMDRSNLARLRLLQEERGGKASLGMLLDYAPGTGVTEVPDPYFGGPGGFERVFDLVEAGCRGLLATLETRLAGSSSDPAGRNP